jgi:hypothetical protein
MSRPTAGWRRWMKLLGVAVVAGVAVFGTYRFRKAQAATEVPTAPARKGEFLVISRCRGQLLARRSAQIAAPTNVPDLRIVWQAPPTSQVNEGDVVVRFDQSSAKQQLQEKEASLKQAQATLDQAAAEAVITAEQDKRDLSASRYQVELAKLEVSKQEIVSALKGEESKIDFALAEKKQRVQAAATSLHEASAKARLASLTRVRDQALYDVNLTKQRLAQMEIKAPLSGLIIFLANYSQGWMNAKPFKVGDQVWPGANIAEIPDLTSIEMEGKIEEIERGRVKSGSPARVRIDSLPELTFSARLSEISVMTQISFDWPPSYSFRGYAKIDNPDPRLRPDMNGTMDVVVDRLADAISVPAKAVFTKGGKPVVYVASGNQYHAREVEVLARNPDEVAVAGIAPGTPVALVEPEARDGKKK